MSSGRTWCLRITAAAVGSLAVLPCIVTYTPVLYFDVDPRALEFWATTELGPPGVAWVSALAAALGLLAVAVCVACGGAVRWWMLALVLPGAIACGVHMRGEVDDRLIAGAWLGAALLAVGAAHLAQHAEARRWIAAVLLAAVVPLAIDAVWYVTVDHPMTVAQFEQNEAQFLESRGWSAGSPEHELYVRRLKTTDALATFGLSNVLGSIAGGLTLLAVGGAVGVMCGKKKIDLAVLFGVLALLGGVTVALTNSRGAMAGAVGGLIAIGAVIVAQRRDRLRWLPSGVAMGMLAAAVIAVLAVGALMPRPPADTPRAVVTLLFRAHYWDAATHVFAEAPWGGVGPAGFQPAYTAEKNPINPEEVQSAHHVFVDWIAQLGVCGVAWSALVLVWLWSAGRAAAPRDVLHDKAKGEPIASATGCWYLAGAVSLALFLVRYQVELPMQSASWALTWLGSLLGCFVVIGMVTSRAGASDRGLRLGLFAGATTLLLHNQIDLTFYNLAGVFPAFCVLGLAGGMGVTVAKPPASGKRITWVALFGVLATVLFVWLAVSHAGRVTSHQHQVRSAAELLRNDRPRLALEALDRASDIIEDPRVLSWRVRLTTEQAIAAARLGRLDEAAAAFDRAVEITQPDRASDLHPAAALRLRAGVQQAAAEVLGEPNLLDDAAVSHGMALTYSPHSLRQRLTLGDLQWQRGNLADAAEQYERALELSELSYLDPAKQMREDDRARVERRLNELERLKSPSDD